MAVEEAEAVELDAVVVRITVLQTGQAKERARAVVNEVVLRARVANLLTFRCKSALMELHVHE